MSPALKVSSPPPKVSTMRSVSGATGSGSGLSAETIAGLREKGVV